MVCKMYPCLLLLYYSYPYRLYSLWYDLGLHRLFDATLDNPDLTASLIPMSDGLLMIRKNSENVILPD